MITVFFLHLSITDYQEKFFIKKNIKILLHPFLKGAILILVATM
jgi:hypothetical protein